MKKEQAVKLIEQVFDQKFDETRFSQFCVNLFNDFNITKTTPVQTGKYIYEPYIDHIKSFKRIGQYVSPVKEIIDVLAVKVKSGFKLERTQTGLRNFAIEYLKRKGNRDTVLIAFYADDSTDWRLSFVKLEYKTQKDDKGKIKAIQEATSARRYSFLVGENEPCHTAKKQFLPLLVEIEKNPDIEDIESCFNIEKVTKEFFEQYKLLFLNLKGNLDSLLKSDKIISTDFSSKSIETEAFAKKLLGQIVFLYFIQKKGWLGVPKNESFGKGNKRFLKSLYKKSEQEGTNFFNAFLEPLFYEALAVQRSSADPSYYRPFDCRIPFLNGGLFEPIKDYDWKKTEINLPNELFSNREITKDNDIGTGILDVFDRYNFTVKEDEPLDKEVAVDPEMLGKVFENLLEVKDRKSKGTYYTPREIVHYMCQESLINYLDTSINSGIVSYQKLADDQTDMFGNNSRSQTTLEIEHEDVKILKEDIDAFIKNSHLVIADNRKDKNQRTWQLPDSIKKHAKLFDKALADVKVCDPAIGSGAFPVGMLNEIIRARTALTPFIGKKETDEDRTQYHLKRECIQNSLYGVDIDESAIDIAKLRLWLSLVVDEESIQDIEPLPNLDYKIVCGNSLLGIPDGVMHNDGLEKEIEQLKEGFFSTTDNREKRVIRGRINKKFQEIISSMKIFLRVIPDIVFDFKIQFSEVYHSKGGFDVVIGNPPYINIYKIPVDLKKTYSNIFTTAFKKYDIYVLFFEKSFQVLNKNGIVSLITSNKYFSQPYGYKLRELLLKRKILSLINFRLNVFEATVDTVITMVKNIECNIDVINFIDITDVVSVKNLNSIQKEKIPIDIIKRLPEKRFRIELTSTKIKLIKKIDSLTVPLREKCYINYGCRLVSKFGDKKKADYVSKVNYNKQLKPFVEGQDIRRYQLKSSRYVDYKPDEHYLALFIELFESCKILSKEIVGKDGLQFAYDNKGFYNDHTVVNCVPWHYLKYVRYHNVSKQLTKEKIQCSEEYNDYLLLAILNSRITYWYFMNLFNIDLHAYPASIQNLKVLADLKNTETKIIALVKTIMKNYKIETDAEIDARIAHLYTLTESEYKLILEGTEDNFKETALKFFRDIEKGTLK